MKKDDLIRSAKTRLIHPLTHPRHFDRRPTRIIVEGKGVTIKDLDGRELIDGFAGLWCVAVGHGNKKINAAIAAQLGKIAYFSSFHGVSTPPPLELADKLISMLDPSYHLTRVWFTCGGSETNETNIKMARLYWGLKGREGKHKIVSRHFSYHGMGLATTAATGIPPFHWNLDPLPEGFIKCAAPYCYQCDFDLAPGECEFECVADLEQLIEDEGPDTIAAFIAEPVIGSGGVIPPPPGYFPRVRELCDRHDILLIMDEVITGFGRTGKMFGHQHWGGIRPDMLSFAKGISSGYVPLGAAVMRGDIYDAIGELQDEDIPLMHGFTYMNHPVACAAGLANLEVIEEEGLVERAAENGAYLLKGLETLKRHRSVGDVRGLGLLAAIELIGAPETRAPIQPENSAPELLVELCWEQGLYIRSSAMETVCIAPALIIDQPTIDRMIEIIDRCIPKMEAKLL